MQKRSLLGQKSNLRDQCHRINGGGQRITRSLQWMEKQRGNLIIATLYQKETPMITMVTEAGMIGRIDLNSSGVGVCFNTIRAKGLDTTRLPIHLGSWMVLGSASAYGAVRALETLRMTSSAYVLIVGAHGSSVLSSRPQYLLGSTCISISVGFTRIIGTLTTTNPPGCCIPHSVSTGKFHFR